jgi:probable rRNA maturation factor
MTRKPEASTHTPSVVIDISALCLEWPDISSLLENAVLAALKGAGYAHPTEVSIVLSDDAFIQTLNKQWRGKDKPTNVLSFPQDEPGMLGDIIMAYETIAREAREQSKTFNNHAIHLTVHGILHLLGHDHEAGEKEEAEMEALEIRILEGLGIKNPYEGMDSTP